MIDTTASPRPAKPRPPASGSPAQKASLSPEELSAKAAYMGLKRRVYFQAKIIAVLSVVLLIMLPLSRPIYRYFSMNPEKKVSSISGLSMPNLTDEAVLSWATTSITEVLTMGFADIDKKLPTLEDKFTDEGWEAYKASFEAMKIRETFKQSQLVLTSVPSNTPVILGQGMNLNKIYQWNVQMPIIMAYATNNNVVTKKRATVTLQITNVPVEQSPAGLAIRNWVIQ